MGPNSASDGGDPRLSRLTEETPDGLLLRLPDRVGWEKRIELALLGLLGLFSLGLAVGSTLRNGFFPPPMLLLILVGACLFGHAVGVARGIRRGHLLVLTPDQLTVLPNLARRSTKTTAAWDQLVVSRSGGRGIAITHPSGRLRVGTALDSSTRDSVCELLAAHRAALFATSADGTLGSASPRKAQLADPLECHYRPGPWGVVRNLLVFAALIGLSAYLGLTNNRPLVVKGIHMGPEAATIFYWACAGLTSLLAIVGIREPYTAWANPRWLRLYPDRLDVVDENTGDVRVLKFEDIQRVEFETHSGLQTALIVRHPDGPCRLPRADLRGALDFDSLRDAITSGFVRHSRR